MLITITKIRMTTIKPTIVLSAPARLLSFEFCVVPPPPELVVPDPELAGFVV